MTMLGTPEPAATDGGAAPPAFAVTVAFDLLDGAAPEFLRLVRANAALSVAREPDCLRFDVLTPLDDAAPQVLLYEIYADLAAFETHLRSEHYLDFDRSSRGLVRRKMVTRFVLAADHDPAAAALPAG